MAKNSKVPGSRTTPPDSNTGSRMKSKHSDTTTPDKAGGMYGDMSYHMNETTHTHRARNMHKNMHDNPPKGGD